VADPLQDLVKLIPIERRHLEQVSEPCKPVYIRDCAALSTFVKCATLSGFVLCNRVSRAVLVLFGRGRVVFACIHDVQLDLHS
jgi:hypothetical protein